MLKLPQNLIDELYATIKNFDDFPQPGIKFKDINPLLNSPALFQRVIDNLATLANDIDKIVCPGARGFLLGAPLAIQTQKPLVIARKKGKLPGANLITQSYELEYGTDTLEMQSGLIQPGDRILVIDDVLASGGTAWALEQMIASQQGQVIKHVFLIEIASFASSKYRESLIKAPIFTILKY